MIPAEDPKAREAISNPELIQITIKGRNGYKVRLRHHIDSSQQTEINYSVDTETEWSKPFLDYPQEVDGVRRWTTVSWGPPR